MKTMKSKEKINKLRKVYYLEPKVAIVLEKMAAEAQVTTSRLMDALLLEYLEFKGIEIPKEGGYNLPDLSRLSA